MHRNFEAIMVVLLTPNEEWLDYLLAEGAEFGPTRYRMDIFGNPVNNIIGNRMILYCQLDQHRNWSASQLVSTTTTIFT
jgi:hypothetical protein